MIYIISYIQVTEFLLNSSRGYDSIPYLTEVYISHVAFTRSHFHSNQHYDTRWHSFLIILTELLYDFYIHFRLFHLVRWIQVKHFLFPCHIMFEFFILFLFTLLKNHKTEEFPYAKKYKKKKKRGKIQMKNTKIKKKR